MTVAKLPESRVALSLHDMLGDEESRQTSKNSAHSEEDVAGAPKKNFQPYHAQSVPKPENLEAHAPTASGNPVTTMMLRNIPNKYTQNTLLQEIDDLGFSGTYDFFYLPMDVHNRSNVGYAFINFLSPSNAERFRRIFSDHRFQRFQSRKISSVCTAHVQGLDSNLRHFENRAVTHSRNDQYRPIVLRGNVRIDFEEAVAAAKGWSKPTMSPVAAVPKPAATAGPVPPKLAPMTAPAAGGDSTSVAGARLGLEAAIRDLLTIQNVTDAKASPPSPPGLNKFPTPSASGCYPQAQAGLPSPPEKVAEGSHDAGNDISQLISLRNMLVGRLRETDTPSYVPKASALAPSVWESPAYISLPASGFGAKRDAADRDRCPPRAGTSPFPATCY